MHLQLGRITAVIHEQIGGLDFKVAGKDETPWRDPITQNNLSFAVRRACMA